MTRGGFYLNCVIAAFGIAGFIGASAFFGYKWLAHDEQNRAYACGSGSRGGTCIEGETTNIVLTILFGVLALVTIWLVAKAIRSYRRGAT